MEGYTKLFSGIIASTLWRYDSDTKVVWITLMAMADQRGDVICSIPGLAHLAGVPLELTKKALAIFLAPDPDSGTKEFEGRRIAEIDRGWNLLTYPKYRALRAKDEKNEADRVRIASQRAVEKSDLGPGIRSSTSPTPTSSSSFEPKDPRVDWFSAAFKLWVSTARPGAGYGQEGREEAKKAFLSVIPDIETYEVFQTDLDAHLEQFKRGLMSRAVCGSFKKFCQNWVLRDPVKKQTTISSPSTDEVPTFD